MSVQHPRGLLRHVESSAKSLDEATLDLWEAPEFKVMRNKAAHLQLRKEVLALATSVADDSRASMPTFKATFDTFSALQLCEEYRHALRLVGLNV